MRKAVGLDWKRKPERIVKILSEINADLIILQEADKRLKPRPGVLPIHQLHQLGYKIAPLAQNPNSHGWHGNSILYRSHYSIESTHCLEVPHLEPRGSVAAIVNIPEMGKISIIGVHLGLTSKQRSKQLQFIDNHVQANWGNVPVVIGGDFNEWRPETIKQALGKQYELVTPGPSFHSLKPKVALDHFAIRGNLQITSSHVHVSPLSRKASDHLPIVLESRFNLSEQL